MAKAQRWRDLRPRPEALKAIDPLHFGSSSAILALLGSMPEGNDASAGSDNGLNFTGFRFNAPMLLDNRAYVAKVDLKLDSMSKHNVSVRTDVADNSRDLALAQYPGQSAQLHRAEYQLRRRVRPIRASSARI